MRSPREIIIDVQIQAVVIYVLVTFWHFTLWGMHRLGANFPTFLQTLYILLPLLTTLLSLIVVESRLRHKESCAWWVYSAVPFGLIPWIWYAYFNLSA